MHTDELISLNIIDALGLQIDSPGKTPPEADAKAAANVVFAML